MKNLILYLISIINNKTKCRHSHALLHSNEGYCPDCGAYLKKYYYVLRCKCCAHKREATRAAFGEVNEIVPISKYCPICGGEEFYIEKYEKLNFVDINYAIEVKEVFDILNAQNNFETSSTTVWVEVPNDDTENGNEIKALPHLTPQIPLKTAI